MNKSVKGAIALSAAGLLLLGGGGTYALWSDEVELNGGAVSSGQLQFTGTTTGTWNDVSSGTPVAIADIADFLVVPGDTLTYTLATTLRAQGENLEATLAADPASVTGDAELLADMAVTTAVSTGGTALTAITEANDNAVIDVVVTFVFDEASTNETQLESLDLSALELTVNQDPR